MIDTDKTIQTQDVPFSSTVITKQTIANYRLVELKGSGGMANVFKAIQLSLDRPVALKIMHPHLNTSETFIARFEKEAKRAAMLHHENIVTIIDYGNDNGEYYIAMEYIDGTNLGEMLKHQKRMPLEICLHICHQVAEGLKYAHANGLVHRDIKPANIMLSTDGRVMITDFGIAKSSEDHSITATGQVIGSPSYMSPEQAAGKAIDHRSDIFSLGIILYEILAGEKPFKGDTYPSLIASIMSEKPEPLGRSRIDITPELDDVVQKALLKDQESRFQSVEELADCLYAQLSKFKISSYRKMMSDYLKSPIRTTQKLRADKITDHLESALYFLAVGEGKLAEAKKEFQEVLRFDKNNVAAKKYLARLESQPLLRNATSSSSIKLSYRYILYALVTFGIIWIIAFIVDKRPSSADFPAKSEIPLGADAILSQATPLNTIPAANGAVAAPAFEIEQYNQQNSEKAKLPITETPEARVSDQKESPPKALTEPATRKELSKMAFISYNYPNQRLSRFGLLKIVSNVTARLDIDQARFCWTNGPSFKLSPGSHLIEASAPGYQSVSTRIYLKRDQVDTLKIELAPTR
jgi:serine/threonine protein kinase